MNNAKLNMEMEKIKEASKSSSSSFRLDKKISLFVFILILAICAGMRYISIKHSNAILIDREEAILSIMAEDKARYIETSIDKTLHDLGNIAFDMDMNAGKLTESIEKLGFLDLAIINSNREGVYLKSGQPVETGGIECVDQAFNGKSGMSVLSVDERNSYLMYAVPIHNGNETSGVLLGKKNIGEINEISGKMTLRENSFAYIFDRNGNLYAYPNNEYIINRTNIFEKAETDKSFSNWAYSLNELGIGNNGVINYEFMGKRYYAGIRAIPNTDWIIGVAVDENDILSGLNYLNKDVVVFFIVLLLFGLAVSSILGKTQSIPLMILSKEIEEFSNYDLIIDEDSTVLKYSKRNDEIGIIARSLMDMQDNFIRLVKDIANSSDKVGDVSKNLMSICKQVSLSSEDVAKAMEEIASGATEQANITEEGVSHIENLGNKISSNKKETTNVMNAVLEIDRLKEEGLNIVNELVNKTKSSNESIMEIANIIRKVSSTNEEVVNITDMIKDIAEQTNLLALNAAIEAARAGESGRGFAVVADEIRKLAEQSNDFAKSISEIIKNLTNEIENTVETMDKVSAALLSQSESVNMTSTKFEGIAESIENIKGLIVSMDESSKEMEDMKGKMVDIIQSLSSISQENAANTEEVSASVEEQTASMEDVAKLSEELARLASETEQTISKFRY